MSTELKFYGRLHHPCEEGWPAWLEEGKCACCGSEVPERLGDFNLPEIVPDRWLDENWFYFLHSWHEIWRVDVTLCPECCDPADEKFRKYKSSWRGPRSRSQMIHLGLTLRLVKHVNPRRWKVDADPEYQASRQWLLRVRDNPALGAFRNEQHMVAALLQEIRVCQSVRKRLARALRTGDLEALPSLAEELTPLATSRNS